MKKTQNYYQRSTFIRLHYMYISTNQPSPQSRQRHKQAPKHYMFPRIYFNFPNFYSVESIISSTVHAYHLPKKKKRQHVLKRGISYNIKKQYYNRGLNWISALVKHIIIISAENGYPTHGEQKLWWMRKEKRPHATRGWESIPRLCTLFYINVVRVVYRL